MKPTPWLKIVMNSLKYWLHLSKRWRTSNHLVTHNSDLWPLFLFMPILIGWKHLCWLASFPVTRCVAATHTDFRMIKSGLPNMAMFFSVRICRIIPAYDINPTLADNQSLLINRSSSESDLNILLTSAVDYMLSSDKAESIITKVKTAMKSWRTEARRLGLPQRDIDMFAPRFDKWIE